ncbi:MAG: carboxypeptidase-like regulatory domain-containing protein [Planctomycetia bacterium]|nr:carboxypeptidase-like regulatory domain-containing protein [Planctomycetia bacterium]
MKKILLLVSVLCCVTVLFCCGCGPKNTFGVVDVQGKITVDGEPVEGISVTMAPADPSQRAAAGVTDAEGKFRVVTPGAKVPGVMPGDYSLTFQKEIWVTADGSPVENLEYDPSKPEPKMFPKDLLPTKYKDAKLSECKVTVVDKNTKIEFDLSSKE